MPNRLFAKLPGAGLRATLVTSAVLTAMLVSGCGGSGGNGGGEPWAATVCKSLKPRWSATSGNYTAMMASLNDPGADPTASWGQIASGFNSIAASFRELETTASAETSPDSLTEIAGTTFAKGRNAAEALELDTTTWAAGLRPPGQGIGGDPSLGLTEVRAAVQEFCG